MTIMHVVLVEPEIPPNTGNIARLCAVTGSELHLIEPLGFRVDDAQMRRAGMDYWNQVTWHRWKNWDDFCSHLEVGARWWWIEGGGPKAYHEVKFGPNDYLVFGRETSGLPRVWLETMPEKWLRIPMKNPAARSLNLSNCVAIVLFEGLRQQGF